MPKKMITESGEALCLTVQEAAEQLGLSTQTVYKLIRTHELPAYCATSGVTAKKWLLANDVQALKNKAAGEKVLRRCN